ncbi:MAG: hypothetical protein J6Y29_03830 [Clostridiales bacterium]|nr:hypothetical protein [Clostridiales bacterium]
MYELWGRNKETKQYEFITRFNDNNQFYYMLDQLDKSKYYEAIITQGQECKIYIEIEEPKKLTKTRYN